MDSSKRLAIEVVVLLALCSADRACSDLTRGGGPAPSSHQKWVAPHYGGSAGSRQEQLQSWMRGIRMMALRR